jgi:hypothetical protein
MSKRGAQRNRFRTKIENQIAELLQFSNVPLNLRDHLFVLLHHAASKPNGSSMDAFLRLGIMPVDAAGRAKSVNQILIELQEVLGKTFIRYRNKGKNIYYKSRQIK